MELVVASHEIIVVALVFHLLGSLNFLYRFVLELIFNLLGGDHTCSAKEIRLFLLFLVLGGLFLELCSLLLPDLFLADSFLGFCLLLFLFLLDNLQLIVGTCHVFPRKLVVQK